MQLEGLLKQVVGPGAVDALGTAQAWNAQAGPSSECGCLLPILVGSQLTSDLAGACSVRPIVLAPTPLLSPARRTVRNQLRSSSAFIVILQLWRLGPDPVVQSSVADGRTRPARLVVFVQRSRQRSLPTSARSDARVDHGISVVARLFARLDATTTPASSSPQAVRIGSSARRTLSIFLYHKLSPTATTSPRTTHIGIPSAFPQVQHLPALRTLPFLLRALRVPNRPHSPFTRRRAGPRSPVAFLPASSARAGLHATCRGDLLQLCADELLSAESGQVHHEVGTATDTPSVPASGGAA